MTKAPKIYGQDKVKKAMEFAIAENIPVLLIGETGTGKTTLVHELALKHKREFSRFNMTGETSVDDFVGKTTLVTADTGNTITAWEDGVLVKAMKNGHWLAVDEINVALPDILLVLNSLLDDGRVITLSHGEKVECHENFRFFATMNPTDEYAGTKELNKALLSRFGCVEYVNYPTHAIETKILVKAGVDEQVAKQMVDVATLNRKSKGEGKVYYTCSTRDLLHWGALVAPLGLQRAYELAILNKANADRTELTNNYIQVNSDYKELERIADTLDIQDVLEKVRSLGYLETEIMKRDKRSQDIRTEANELLDKARLSEAKVYNEIRKEVMAEVKVRLARAMNYFEEV